MKKFISGVVVGVLLFAGGSVFANSVSLIGQKVQGIFSIESNGAKVADAIVVNGSAYAPVRAVADATGAKLTVEGKKIKMEAAADTSLNVAAQLINERADVVRKITALENEAKTLTERDIPTSERLAKELANNGNLGKEHAQNVESYRARLAEIGTQVTGLQTQLTAIDAKITKLSE
ncbi:hypothetical protein [Paenibacillus sp. FSL R7-0128]|uniref:hypothetical protein n=1 Tax=Paenibacillus sp. FSL R7-0128 TaxID=2954529 RepID=UPI0030FC751A